ncbi:MAG TPA: NAD-dependent deacylase [Bacteroidales bacterium]|nr:NAD-dependent deacylase [Bacteroidales bacterium]HOS57553.1 NAD-dependent deacylase [Bacteroidales bacterium]HRR04243.1 NAD-dependent deacylase [Bacteroidales bacterium]HRT13548.1 NAD-dependent deacylase [Bacteroidales bacterium]HXK74072.1 NAD-dependent deacylase [Bacteroidales bacterium]
MKKKIVILSGAGISAESGIKTFRDSGGLWESYDVQEVASIDGWYANPQLVNDFYNERRKQLKEVEPNQAHRIIAELERDFDVTVITQNVDDLHDRAGSSHIIHLHGELCKICNESKSYTVDIGYEPLEFGRLAPDGTLFRPFIVWFGEAVPLLLDAINEVKTADIVIIIGTSLNVYPAASLFEYAPRNSLIYLIDPNEVSVSSSRIEWIKEKATVGMELLKTKLYDLL